MSPLPRLELAETRSPFDEAVLIIDGHEEETITIACPGSLALAKALIAMVYFHRAALAVLDAGDIVEVPQFLKSEER
jgi:hypothetical protein